MDLNHRPATYKAAALTTELRAHGVLLVRMYHDNINLSICPITILTFLTMTLIVQMAKLVLLLFWFLERRRR